MFPSLRVLNIHGGSAANNGNNIGEAVSICDEVVSLKFFNM
ncbi:MAG: hypothetical protein ACFFG0_45610 [Candidatus Thorarchaeota archaeon]